MDDQADSKSAISDAQARRVQQLRRCFQRELNHRPTVLQRSRIDTASVMKAKAEAAALDPSVSANDCVRLFNAAAKAEREMFESFAAKPKQLGPDSLKAYARDKYRVPA
jgi:hypothetical protein